MVIPTPDGNDAVMELLLLHSMKDDDVVTLSPTEVKLSDKLLPSSFTINDPVFVQNRKCLTVELHYN